jgi:hypothetical protein
MQENDCARPPSRSRKCEVYAGALSLDQDPKRTRGCDTVATFHAVKRAYATTLLT